TLLWSKRDDPHIRERRELITFKFLGALPDESWKNIVLRMKPSAIRDSLSPLRLDSSRIVDRVAGAQLFHSHCASCHGDGGQGGNGHIGADLTSDDIQLKLSDLEIYKTLTQGLPGTNMPPSTVNIVDGLQITAYVRTLSSKTLHTNGKRGAG